jgi:hypothetical protein
MGTTTSKRSSDQPTGVRKVSSAALRAAYLIGARLSAQIQSHPCFWTADSYSELAALIDGECGEESNLLRDEIAALRTQISEMKDGVA